jgi:membrane-bound ClpP family serine protease
VIVLGLILLLLDLLLLHTGFLFWIGIILLVIGIVLALTGTLGGRTVGGRRHWY